jgi:YVTN family beta-propeller protein
MNAKSMFTVIALACSLLITPRAHSDPPVKEAPTQVFVVNQADSTVSLVDLKSMKELRTFHVGYNPYFVAVSGDQSTLAVTVEGDQMVKFYDTRTFKQKGELSIGKMYAEHMMEMPDGKTFMMANRYGNAVLFVNFQTMQIEKRIENVSSPHNIRLGNTQEVAFATSKNNPGVAVIDLKNRSLRNFVPMKFIPRGLASSPDDSYFYCGGNWISGIFMYESATGKLVRLCQMPLPGKRTDVIENTYHGIETVNDSIVIGTCEGMSSLDIVNTHTGALLSRTEEVSMPGALMAWPGKPGWYVFTNMKSSTVQTFHLTGNYKIELGPALKCGSGRVELPKRFTYFWGNAQ